MTQEQFHKRSFKFNMAYDFVDGRNGIRVNCLLVAVNFDREVLCLWPIPSNTHIYDDNDTEFWVNYQLCELHLPQLKLAKL